MEARLEKFKDRCVKEREITTALNIINSHVAQGSPSLHTQHLYQCSCSLSWTWRSDLARWDRRNLGPDQGLRPLKISFADAILLFHLSFVYISLFTAAWAIRSDQPAWLLFRSVRTALPHSRLQTALRTKCKSAVKLFSMKVKGMVINLIKSYEIRLCLLLGMLFLAIFILPFRSMPMIHEVPL